jgi:hypothetical protein
LNQHGKTEVVTVVISLKPGTDAEGLANRLKKFQGPLGQSYIPKKTNHLILQDRVANLRQMAKTLKDLHQSKGK